jgi:hypothetical protein
MPPLPDAIILVLAPFAPLVSDRLWRHAQVLWLGARLAPGARTVTTALRVMGRAGERRCPNEPRVLNRAIGSARQGRGMLLGLLITLLGPPGAPIVLGADDPVERRAGRKSRAKGCDREAVRSSHTPVIRGVGLNWGSMTRLVPGPWRPRGWARPFRPAWCWPAETSKRRRHNTSVDGVRQLRPQVRRWRPGRPLVWVVEGGLAAVPLALACVQHHVTMVARWRWDAAL